MGRSRARVGVVVVLALSGAVAGCKNDASDAPKPAPAAPIASSTSMSAKAIEYDIAADGKTSIDMPAPKERIKADTTAAKGQLHVNPANLGATRGDVFVDLTTLTTHTFGDADKDATQTKHARTWLQVDDMEADPAVKERNRWVHFAIRSVDGLSANDLTQVAPTKEGNDDVARRDAHRAR